MFYVLWDFLFIINTFNLSMVLSYYSPCKKTQPNKITRKTVTAMTSANIVKWLLH